MFNYVAHFLLTMVWLAVMIPSTGIAQEAKVVLTGNMADLKDPREIFPLIENYCSVHQGPVLLALNGDNFEASIKDEVINNWLLSASGTLDRFPNLQIIITQGDRDWDDSGKKGWKKVQALEKILKSSNHKRLHVFINHGCPGPWTFSFTPEVNLVIINSQWWNHPYEKPLPGSDACDIADPDVFVEELEGILDESADKNTLLLTHFPFESLGIRGGHFPVSSYLLPPVIGGAIAGYHQNVGTTRDITNNRFGPIRYRLEGVLQNYSSLIVASSHESNHSILKASQNYYVNSGALVNGDFVAGSSKAILRSSKPGFIEISYQKTGEVQYAFFEIKNQKIEKENHDVLF